MSLTSQQNLSFQRNHFFMDFLLLTKQNYRQVQLVWRSLCVLRVDVRSREQTFFYTRHLAPTGWPLRVHDATLCKQFWYCNTGSLDHRGQGQIMLRASGDFQHLFFLKGYNFLHVIQHDQGFCHSCRILNLRNLPSLNLRMFTVL
jgi:hypothetical protein